MAAAADVRAASRRVDDYRPVFLACRDAAGASRLAIRRMRLDGGDALLTVDAETLATVVEPAANWRCAETTDAEQGESRFSRALRLPGRDEGFVDGRSVSTNAGLAHGAGGGSFLTGDLCPSHRPLDRAFLERLAAAAPGAPIALSVSGRWLLGHGEDFDWLMERARSGALAISWVDHSFNHPYVPGLADARNYLLRPGADLDAEIFATERLLIEKGATPSVFFRFPGLVADTRLVEMLRRRHLIALGADAWLVLSPAPRPGSIVLIHPNGNEPAGLRLFERLLVAGRLQRPFRPIEQAPE
ncbi:polysaccharide deacetylase [Methylosinus sp. Sm6]|uniref:polysaccharide deacetylase n=1 Tax=Methylosinus sp. Sm6 TaxID=2866948 RepID=UPI002105B389|nr:polysaccharide deacetylase [Methylosinus sp. Sm6]